MFSTQLKNKLELVSLIGNASEETAFLEVRSNEICEEYNLAPLLPSKRKIIIDENFPADDSNNLKNVQVFVNHIDAVSAFRFNLAKFFSEEINHH